MTKDGASHMLCLAPCQLQARVGELRLLLSRAHPHPPHPQELGEAGAGVGLCWLALFLASLLFPSSVPWKNKEAISPVHAMPISLGPSTLEKWPQGFL